MADMPETHEAREEKTSNTSPPIHDPSASAREWAGLTEKWRGIIDSRLASIVRDLSAFARTCTAVDDGFAKELDAFNAARRVLADAPALLARLEEAERVVHEVHGLLIDAMSQHNKGIDDDWDLVARAHSEADAFLSPSAPRAVGPSRG